MARVAVLGSGAWGTTLGVLATRNGHTVRCLGRDAALMDEFNAARQNTRYLPDCLLPEGFAFTADPEEAFAGAETVILAVPSEHLRASIQAHAEWLNDPDLKICSAIKGFLDDKLLRLSVALPELIGPHPLVILSGPNLAREVMRGDPTVTIVASTDDPTIHYFQDLFASRNFRVYGSHDVVGVELGGAVKNILAIAGGIARHLGMGMNTQAALITRGMAEMADLGKQFGAQRETLFGIAGIGDAVCTCFSELSRNVQLGEHLAAGGSLTAAQQALRGIAEGITTARHVAAFAQANRPLDLPITEGVAMVLDGTATVPEVVEALMERTWRMELP